MVGLLGTFKFGLKIARFSCYNSLTKPMSFLYACLFLQDVWRAEAVVYLGKEFLLDLVTVLMEPLFLFHLPDTWLL